MKAIANQERPRSLIYRIAVFVYGVAAYIIGVGVLVALILTMLGVLSFTGGPLGSLGFSAAVVLDVVLLVAFALQHSVMARSSFKAGLTRIFPKATERSTYVLATGLVLGLVLVLWQPMPSALWSVATPVLYWSFIGVGLAGWTYLLAASFAINHFELFGLRQVYQALRGRPVTPVPFTERWMYRFDRHPIMTGILIGLWVTPTMTLDRLLFAAGSTIYIGIGVYFEERSLRRNLGQVYENYRKRVGTIVPTITSRSSTPTPGAASTAKRKGTSS